MVNLNKVSNFLKKDSDYIIVVDRSGNIWDAKRSSIFTFLGRAFGWLTGHSYDLKKVAEAVKNNPAFQNQDNEQMNEFIKKLNKKIRSYNLKHSENGARKIPSLSESYNCNRKKSSGSTSLNGARKIPSLSESHNCNRQKSSGSTSLGALDLALSMKNLNNFDAQQAEPRDRYTVRVTKNVEFCLSIDNGLIYPIFPEDKTEVFQILIFAEPAEWAEQGMFSLIRFNTKIPPIFIHLAISDREKFLFIDRGPIRIRDGNDDKKVALTGKEGGVKRIYSTNFSKFLKLSDEEKKLLIEACKFLTYASRAIQEPERFELSLESLSKIIKLIDKIGPIIARLNRKKFKKGINRFNQFSKIMKQVASISS